MIIIERQKKLQYINPYKTHIINETDGFVLNLEFED